MTRRVSPRRAIPFARKTLLLSLVCALVLIGTSALAGAASSTASAGKLSARLSKTSFTSSQAGSVKLTYKISTSSKSFSYRLTFKQGKKWKTVKSVKRKGSFKGSKTTTVKKLFAKKPIKVGSYRLKLSADTGSKQLSFKVVKAASPAITLGGTTGGGSGGSGSGDGGAGTGGAGFTITGSVSGLSLGQTKPIGLTLTNPHSVQIFVTQLIVTLPADSTPPGCSSASNLRVIQSNASSANPITIPASGSVTLTSAPRAPQITFLNLPDVNQDVCKNKSFELTYSGSAHS